MLITKRTVAFIQTAGQAIDSASAALSETVRSQAEEMLTRVAASPFGPASTRELEQFRLAARLGQELIAMEQQLRRIHATASELADAKTDAKAGAKAALAKAQSDNDGKLQAYLETVLKKGEWTRLHGRAVAQGSGLPTGSVGASMRRLLASGAVHKGTRGMYKLAT